MLPNLLMTFEFVLVSEYLTEVATSEMDCVQLQVSGGGEYECVQLVG